MKLRDLRWVIACTLLILSVLCLSAGLADTVDSGTCGENLSWTLDSSGTLRLRDGSESHFQTFRERFTPFRSHSANKSSSVMMLVNIPLYSFCVNPYVVISVLLQPL